MNARYVVFDVETPNYANNRMSAIGICVVENMAIKQEFYTLIDPETHFDDFNIRLTGITPEMTASEKTFGELWFEGLSDILCSGILVAHNASFDMSVLAKCMQFYGISEPKYMKYACTVRMSRKMMPYLPNHKLNTVSDSLNIPLDHHNAGSDAHAAAEILVYCIKNNCDIASFIKKYSMLI